MDINGTDCSGSKDKPVDCLNPQNGELDGEREVDNESESLLPARGGGILGKTDKPPRKVQWNDKNGNKLAEILEFQPSDSDSDDEDLDSCICIIM